MIRSRYRLVPATILLLGFTLPGAPIRGASLVRDIRTGGPGSQNADSRPRELTRVGERVYFTAFTPATGRELWRTDGTPTGTRLMDDRCPGRCSSGIRGIGAVGETFVWSASHEDSGQDSALWSTDGTPEGTLRLTPPGTSAFIPEDVTGRFRYGFRRVPHGGELFLVACTGDEAETCDLWRTDGTLEGTRGLKDVLGLPDGIPFLLRSVGERLYFAYGGRDGLTLWVTDGTPPGTRELVTVPFFQDSPRSFTAAGERLYFASEQALWTSDGTAEGTLPLVEFDHFRALRRSDTYQTAGERVYFAVNDPEFRWELWTSDGTPGGTRRRIDPDAAGPSLAGAANLEETLAVVAGGAVFFGRQEEEGERGISLWLLRGAPERSLRLLPPEYEVVRFLRLVDLGGRAVFLATDDGGLDLELWVTDGTLRGTRPVDPGCGPCSRIAELQELSGGSASFFALGRLWVTDGTAAGTHAVTARVPGFRIDDTRYELVELGGRYLFPAEDGRGVELWTSDGESASGGTQLLADLNLAAPSSDPFALTPFGEEILFSACDGVSRQVWRSDGKEGGTRRLTPRRFEVGCSGFRHEMFPRPVVLGETVLFFSHPEFPGSRNEQVLWRSDGTAPGTFPLLDFDPFNVPASELFVFQGRAHLAVSRRSDRGRVLSQSFWSTDGTRAGTEEAFGAPAGTTWGVARSIHVESDAFYFVASDEGGVEQVWRSDGTTAGTFPVTEFPRSPTDEPSGFTAFDGALFFVAEREAVGTEVWRSDGTPGSAEPLTDLAPGRLGSFPTDLLAHDGALYFFADAPRESGDEEARVLYRSDGTEAGTAPVASFRRLDDHLFERVPAGLTSFGGDLYFQADDGERGPELWRSDGTPGGTRLLRDLYPGPRGGSPRHLTPYDGALYLTALHPALGEELWVTDGTREGTGLAADVAPGAPSSYPEQLTVAAGELFFTADDTLRGRELWRLGGQPPPSPPPGPWLESAGIPDFRFKVRIGDGADARPGRRAAGCIPETLCVEGAVPGRSEVFLRMVGPKPNGLVWPTLVKFSTSTVEVWMEQESTGLVRHYTLAGTGPEGEELPGSFDREGFLPGPGWTAPRAGRAGAPPLDPDEFFTSEEFPGFRFRVRLSAADGAPLPVRLEEICLPQTVCLSGSVPGRSELFLRLVGPKPNGYLWPTLVRFSTSTIDVWIERTATGETRHYRLAGAAPGSSDLTGLFDRDGFQP